MLVRVFGVSTLVFCSSSSAAPAVAFSTCFGGPREDGATDVAVDAASYEVGFGSSRLSYRSGRPSPW